MGCRFNSGAVLKSAYSKQELFYYLEDIIEDAEHDSGHGGYTGTFAEAEGIDFRPRKKFETIQDAEDWLDRNAPKWGPIVVVSAGDHWVYGANCSS